LTTIFKPHSCACVAEYEEPVDIRKAVLIVKCRSHNTFQEMIDFARSVNDTQAQIERKKPIYQRR